MQCSVFLVLRQVNMLHNRNMVIQLIVTKARSRSSLVVLVSSHKTHVVSFTTAYAVLVQPLLARILSKDGKDSALKRLTC